MTATAALHRPDYRYYRSIAQRRAAWVLLGLILGVGLMTVRYSSAATRYEAAATVLVKLRGVDASGVSIGGGVDYNGGVIATEIQVIQSRIIRQRVEKRLGRSAGIRATEVKSASLIEFHSSGPSPEAAANTANAYATEYRDYRREQSQADYDSAIDQLASKSKELQGRVRDLTDELAKLPENSDARQQTLALSAGFSDTIRGYETRVSALRVNAALVTGGIQMIEPAVPPIEPSSTSPTRILVTGLLVGSLLGLAFGATAQWFDDRIHSPESLTARLNAPVIGTIPKIRGWSMRSTPPLFFASPRGVAAGEAYRELRSTINHLLAESGARLVQVTSPNARAGKSTTAINLGVLLARSGRSTLLVDMDLRAPQICEAMRMVEGPGFADIVGANAAIGDVIVATPEHGLSLLPAGHNSNDNPAEMIATHGGMIREFLDYADVVLVDSGALQPYAESMTISPRVDLVILVVRMGRTTFHQLEESQTALDRVGATLGGIVLTSVNDGQRWVARIKGSRRERPNRAFGGEAMTTAAIRDAQLVVEPHDAHAESRPSVRS